MSEGDPSFEQDVRPLFRAGDVEAMLFAFDLSSYDDVRTYAEDVFDRLEDGSMPCDDPWPESRVTLFRAWIDTGMRP